MKGTRTLNLENGCWNKTICFGSWLVVNCFMKFLEPTSGDSLRSLLRVRLIASIRREIG